MSVGLYEEFSSFISTFSRYFSQCLCVLVTILDLLSLIFWNHFLPTSPYQTIHIEKAGRHNEGGARYVERHVVCVARVVEGA